MCRFNTVGITRNITARKNAELTLRESEKRLTRTENPALRSRGLPSVRICDTSGRGEGVVTAADLRGELSLHPPFANI
jgi:hypothetical protein